VRIFNLPDSAQREFLVSDASGPYEVVRCSPLEGEQAGMLRVEMKSIGYR
jgi:hypothetical protein